jgi:hypothetical protein
MENQRLGTQSAFWLGWTLLCKGSSLVDTADLGSAETRGFPSCMHEGLRTATCWLADASSDLRDGESRHSVVFQLPDCVLTVITQEWLTSIKLRPKTV